MSFLGGQPEYLQQESDCCLEKYIFIGQILGMDLPEEVNKIFYLTENIGYIFLNCNMKLNSIQIYNFINFFKKNIQRGSII